MPSFTSSSERLPVFRAGIVLATAFVIFFAAIFLLELALAQRGYVAGFCDDEAAWQHERERAGELGAKGLVLVGGSRIQLGADVALLAEQTRRPVVQLAIDGSAFPPVLHGLANDARIKGVVLVDFPEYLLASAPDPKNIALHYENDYQREQGSLPGFDDAEAWLEGLRNQHLRSYADGARPLTSLRGRVLDPDPAPQYLQTLKDRSKLADYSHLEMPLIYHFRVMGELHVTDAQVGEMDDDQREAFLQSRVAALRPVDNRIFLRRLQQMADDVKKIEARGGQVFFINMPISGMMRGIREHRYPRDRFWKHVQTAFPGRTLHAEDDAAMRGFVCPDGSHLDKRDRDAFTLALAKALQAHGMASLH